MKFIKITAVNIILLIICIFICDLCIYKSFAQQRSKDYILPPFAYQIHPYCSFIPDYYFDGSDNIYKGRKPDGLKYLAEGKTPIVIFGGSFAHGQHLNADETFSARLSELLHRPVFNRAAPGRGIQHMLYQAEHTQLYSDIKTADTVIYIFINDHYRRMKVSHIDILDTNFAGSYKIKNKRLVLQNYKNPLKNLIKSSYTVKLLNQKAVKHYIDNENNAGKLTDETMLYFIQTRNILEQHWNRKIDFIVLFYDSVMYEELLTDKLWENGFRAYSINEDAAPDVNLNAEEYRISKDNLHPNAAAWREITPLTAEKLGLK